MCCFVAQTSCWSCPAKKASLRALANSFAISRYVLFLATNKAVALRGKSKEVKLPPSVLMVRWRVLICVGAGGRRKCAATFFFSSFTFSTERERANRKRGNDNQTTVSRGRALCTFSTYEFRSWFYSNEPRPRINLFCFLLLRFIFCFALAFRIGRVVLFRGFHQFEHLVAVPSVEIMLSGHVCVSLALSCHIFLTQTSKHTYMPTYQNAYVWTVALAGLALPCCRKTSAGCEGNHASHVPVVARLPNSSLRKFDQKITKSWKGKGQKKTTWWCGGFLMRSTLVTARQY